MLARAAGAAPPLAAAAALVLPALLRRLSTGTLPRRSLAAVEKLFKEMEGRCVDCRLLLIAGCPFPNQYPAMCKPLRSPFLSLAERRCLGKTR